MDDPLLPFLVGLQVPLLTGTPHVVSRRPLIAMNATALISNGVADTVYGKQHLVPFAETVPFWQWSIVRVLFGPLIGAPWTPGAGPVEFSVPVGSGVTAATLRFQTPICFEDAFAPLVREMVRAGAEVLINVTNDSWSRTVSALTQHWVAAKLRAVETRRYLVRATNGGVTGVVGPNGRATAGPAPFFTEAFLSAEIPLSLEGTLPVSVYLRLGDWLPLLLAASLLLLLGRDARRQWKCTE